MPTKVRHSSRHRWLSLVHTHLHACTQTHTHIHKLHTYVHACRRICTRTYVHTVIQTYIRKYSHTDIHTEIQTCIETQIFPADPNHPLDCWCSFFTDDHCLLRHSAYDCKPVLQHARASFSVHMLHSIQRDRRSVLTLILFFHAGISTFWRHAGEGRPTTNCTVIVMEVPGLVSLTQSYIRHCVTIPHV